MNWRSTLQRDPLFPLPKGQPYSRRYPGQPVCRTCKQGYGSPVDGVCRNCRGCTAWSLMNGLVADERGYVMIEVTITEGMLHTYVQKLGRPSSIPYGERLGLAARSILRNAGIPLTFDFRPEKDPKVESGRLEWEYDSLRKVRVFRWHP